MPETVPSRAVFAVALRELIVIAAYGYLSSNKCCAAEARVLALYDAALESAPEAMAMRTRIAWAIATLEMRRARGVSTPAEAEILRTLRGTLPLDIDNREDV